MAQYGELDPRLLRETIATLSRRVGERFPLSGLYRVSIEMAELADKLAASTLELSRPMWVLRLGVVLSLAAIAWGLVRVAPTGEAVSTRVSGISDLLQGLESGVNVVILLVIGIASLISLESRFKRRRAFASLHRVRSMVHIIDMHQLTKDPVELVTPGMATATSPARAMTRFELVRYLDYCSEMLSLASKLAALHAQSFHDVPVLEAVNDLELLVASLSNKIWQKITILDLTASDDARPPPAA